MKVAQVTVPLTAMLVFSASSAVAGPQSMLDPYANVKAPSSYTQAAHKKVKVKPQPTPSNSVTIGAPATSQVQSTSIDSPGIMSGTKEIMHGFSTATKGAANGIVNPTKKLGSGMVTGSKKVGHSLAAGVKNSEETRKTLLG